MSAAQGERGDRLRRVLGAAPHTYLIEEGTCDQGTGGLCAPRAALIRTIVESEVVVRLVNRDQGCG
jgi:hypothetical protein